MPREVDSAAWDFPPDLPPPERPKPPDAASRCESRVPSGERCMLEVGHRGMHFGGNDNEWHDHEAAPPRDAATRDLRADAWAFVEKMATEPHDLSTPVMPSNLARELLAARADLIRSYEAKVQDLAQETRRSSFLQKQLDTERQSLTELWERYEALRRESSDRG